MAVIIGAILLGIIWIAFQTNELIGAIVAALVIWLVVHAISNRHNPESVFGEYLIYTIPSQVGIA